VRWGVTGTLLLFGFEICSTFLFEFLCLGLVSCRSVSLLWFPEDKPFCSNGFIHPIKLSFDVPLCDSHDSRRIRLARFQRRIPPHTLTQPSHILLLVGFILLLKFLEHPFPILDSLRSARKGSPSGLARLRIPLFPGQRRPRDSLCDNTAGSIVEIQLICVLGQGFLLDLTFARLFAFRLGLIRGLFAGHGEGCHT
jgi:hypothetical protein